MTRLFWAGLSYELLPDGRTLLTVDFQEGRSGTVHQWTPRWRHMLELTRRAYDVEVANETSSPYEPSLRAARDLYSVSVIEPRNQESSPGDKPLPRIYCYECDWHSQDGCCEWCQLRPEIHQ